MKHKYYYTIKGNDCFSYANTLEALTIGEALDKVGIIINSLSNQTIEKLRLTGIQEL